ncbi:pyridoxamine 5'-phosphate oxidase family protein [Paenibacillus sp.]|uniref:pyridoxamine 5'-phosphate oxidase family protein n=1 Tax=Paenibacillus sp. TaxID=58172 RepID=UPI002D63FBE7|nr:pyridoxamine 5'-phosphate oxidase family protein [Paenibacillus sp.]HZG86530.1 pyridoxamine 5'-phosphate oxidase family protein [Paenibacillus sp.]
MSVYHLGELTVQRMAGVSKVAEQNGKSVRSEIPQVAADFLRQQTMIVAGTTDGAGDVWASMLTGPAGFIRVADPVTVELHPFERDDAAYSNIQGNPEIGLLAIELVKRRRMRMNGQAALRPDGGITVLLEQVYSNCPKYIQAREQPAREAALFETVARDELTASQERWIRQADTFFIATSAADGKTDASHRGGTPGFVRLAGGELRFPDYFGNSMFNTLGNIYSNPRCGLIFIDFETGGTLQLTGDAAIDWNPASAAEFPGAERVVVFRPRRAVERIALTPAPWSFLSASPFNPK